MAANMEEPQAPDELTSGNQQASAQLSLVVLGDKGCGKSTLAGHLVSRTGTFDKKSEDFALLFNQASQAKLVGPALAPAATENGEMLYVCSENCRFTVAEAPAERERLKSLTARGFPGAADAVLLLASAAPGDLERGLSPDGCTREHALLARVLRAGQLVVGVSKMDAVSSGYCEACFEEVKKALGKVLQAVGFTEDVPFVPVSGLHGDNLFEESPKMPWYKGPTLLQLLDRAKQSASTMALPLRVTVQEAYHLDSVGAVVVGCVEQGILRLATQLRFAPGGATGRVKSVEVEHEAVREARPRMQVSFALEGLGAEDLRRGMVAAEVARPALEVETFLAHLVVLRGPGEVRPGLSPALAFHATQMACRIEELVGRLDRRTGELCEACPTALRVGDVGLVRLRPEQPLCVEAYADCPRLGHFTSPPEQTALTLMGVICEVQTRQSAALDTAKEAAVEGSKGKA